MSEVIDMALIDSLDKTYLSNDDLKKLADERAKCRLLCKNCGHSTNVSHKRDKIVCSYCGHYVFREEKDEFKYRMLERLRKKK